jgi:hypothetical protein
MLDNGVRATKEPVSFVVVQARAVQRPPPMSSLKAPLIFAALASVGSWSPRLFAQTDRDTKQTALPAVAANSPAGIFGDRHELAISSDAGFELSNTNLSGQGGSTTTLTLRPAVDYFVIDSLSIGGFLGLDYTAPPGGSTTAFSIGPRVGYNLRFSERFSVWPKIGFSFASTTEKRDAVTLPDGTRVDPTDTTNTSVQLNIFVPVMFHPVQHFFIGLGPAFDLDLSGSNKATTIAARLTLGGWM